MSDPPHRQERFEETADKLLATAERCFRLAMQITDRNTIERLLEVARECEEKAAAIRRGESRDPINKI
jgi:hypothetical protein